MTIDSTGALRGVRVLDLSRVLAGPLCTQLLADHGAMVIKVEPPSGDETRTWGPPFVESGTAAYYAGINRNKKNVSLDLRSSEGQVILERLLGEADVMVENFKASTLERWGFDDERLERDFPRLVRCRVTGFGTDGPMGGLPGYDAALQAYSGLMSINGDAGGPPVRVGVPIVDMVTGVYAFSGILLALLERQQSGRGQLVDCTLLDTGISLLHPHLPAYLADGRIPQRSGSAHPTIAPYDTYEAADGHIFVGAGNTRQFHALVDLLGLEVLKDDDRFAENPDRVTNYPELRPLLVEAIKDRKRHDLARDLLSRGVPAAAVHNISEALEDPQVRHRQMVVELDDYRGAGIPIKLSRTPGSVRFAPRPKGADNDEILGALADTTADDAAKGTGGCSSPTWSGSR